MSYYDGQYPEGGMELLQGEQHGLLFTELDRREANEMLNARGAGQAANNGHLIERLQRLAVLGNSHQAQYFLEQSNCRVGLPFDELILSDGERFDLIEQE